MDLDFWMLGREFLILVGPILLKGLIKYLFEIWLEQRERFEKAQKKNRAKRVQKKEGPGLRKQRTKSRKAC